MSWLAQLRSSGSGSLRLSAGEKQRIGAVLRPIIFVYLLGMAVMLIFPKQVQVFALLSDDLSPTRWHTLLTYAALHSSLLHLLQVVAFTALPLFVLAGRMPARHIAVAVVGAYVLGGLLFVLMYPGRAVLIGGTTATWGLAGGVVGLWLRNRKSFRLLSSAYAVLTLLVILLTLFSESDLEQALATTGSLFAVGTYLYASVQRNGLLQTAKADSTT